MRKALGLSIGVFLISIALLELAGVTAPKSHRLDGISMASALLEGKRVGGRQLFWNGRAMRDEKWKLVLQQKGFEGPGLYNLDEDLREQSNLADKYPQRVREMTAATEAWKIDVADGATEQPEPPEGVRGSQG